MQNAAIQIKVQKSFAFRPSASRANKLLLFHALFVCTAMQRILRWQSVRATCTSRWIWFIRFTKRGETKETETLPGSFWKIYLKTWRPSLGKTQYAFPCQLTSNADIASLHEPGIILLKNLLKKLRTNFREKYSHLGYIVPRASQQPHVISTLVLLNHNENSGNLWLPFRSICFVHRKMPELLLCSVVRGKWYSICSSLDFPGQTRERAGR